MAREYDVTLVRTTVEKITVTVEAPNPINASVRAALKCGGQEAWGQKDIRVDVEAALWRQGGE